MLAPEGQYYNYSGCGNTFNCNDPIVRHFILDCLRFWVQVRAQPAPSSVAELVGYHVFMLRALLFLLLLPGWDMQVVAGCSIQLCTHENA